MFFLNMKMFLMFLRFRISQKVLFPTPQAEELNKELKSQDKKIEDLTEKLTTLEAQVKVESKKFY